METGIKWSMSMNGTMEWFIWRVAMTREVSWRDASLPLVDLWEVKHTRCLWIVGCGCSMLWYCKSACRGETFSNHGSRLCDLDSIHALVLWIDTRIYQTAVVTARPSTLHLRRWQCLDPSWRLSDHFGSLCKKWSLWMPLRSFETEMLKCFQWLSIRSGWMWISHWLHLDISQKCIQINDSVIQAFLVPRPTVPPHLEEREHQWFGTVQHIQFYVQVCLLVWEAAIQHLLSELSTEAERDHRCLEM